MKTKLPILLITCYLFLLNSACADVSESPSLYGLVSKKSAELGQCLRDCYGVDQKTATRIILKLHPLLEDPRYTTIIDDFIKKSEELDIRFIKNKSADPLNDDDAVLKAAKWHKVLFESPYVRILWTFMKPGEVETAHLHQWKSLMIIIQAAKFETKNRDGSVEEDDYPIGVYELPPETQPAAYTNVGNTAFKALRFEIK